MAKKTNKACNRDKLIQTILEILGDVPVDLSEISNGELSKRVERILALETISGILKDLSPEQKKILDKVIKRRPLFNKKQGSTKEQ